MLIDGKPGSSTVNHTVSGIKTIVRSAGEKSMELLAVDAQTGKPIQNADVTVYTAKNRSYEQVKEISRLKTDKNGLCIMTRTIPDITLSPKYPLRQTVIHLLQTYLTQAIGIDTTKRKRPLFSPIARSIVRGRPSISREYDTSTIRKKVA